MCDLWNLMSTAFMSYVYNRPQLYIHKQGWVALEVTSSQKKLDTNRVRYCFSVRWMRKMHIMPTERALCRILVKHSMPWRQGWNKTFPAWMKYLTRFVWLSAQYYCPHFLNIRRYLYGNLVPAYKMQKKITVWKCQVIEYKNGQARIL